MMRDGREFEISASNVIEELYERDHKKSLELLSHKLKSWRGENLFQLAHTAGQVKRLCLNWLTLLDK